MTGNSIMKGLFIGINYFGTESELGGCINDVKCISQLYRKLYGLTNIILLTDDGPTDKLPTRKNILKWIDWLVSGNKPGEQLFFHYSGHGSYITDANRDEDDGKDECIIPCDYLRNGYIIDDELNDRLVKNVKECYLFGVMDSCHSGTALDLNYTYQTGSIVRTGKRYDSYPILNVALLSGCADNQTSADTSASIDGKLTNCGALSWSLYYTLKRNPNLTYEDLIGGTRNLLRTRYTQRPQLSFNARPQLNAKVVRGDKITSLVKRAAGQKRFGSPSVTNTKVTSPNKSGSKKRR